MTKMTSLKKIASIYCLIACVCAAQTASLPPATPAAPIRTPPPLPPSSTVTPSDDNYKSHANPNHQCEALVAAMKGKPVDVDLHRGFHHAELHQRSDGPLADGRQGRLGQALRRPKCVEFRRRGRPDGERPLAFRPHGHQGFPAEGRGRHDRHEQHGDPAPTRSRMASRPS